VVEVVVVGKSSYAAEVVGVADGGGFGYFAEAVEGWRCVGAVFDRANVLASVLVGEGY
jgi:hypothetical protein